MKKLKDLKIGGKIILSFITVIVLMSVMLLVTQVAMITISRDMETFYEQEFQIVAVSQAVMTDLQGYAKGLARVALAAENVEGRTAADALTYRNERTDEMNNYLTAMGTDIQTLAGLPLQSQDELTTIQSMYDTLTSETKQMTAMYNAGQVESGLQLANGTVEQNAVAIREALKTIIQRAQLRAKDKHDTTMQLVKRQQVMMLALAGFILAVTVVLCAILIRNIKDPLSEMENAAKKLAEGDLSQEIHYRSKDELGSLAESLRNTITALRLYIHEIDTAMGAIGNGKLNYTSKVE